MKKVIGMLALLALVGNIANAEVLKNFKYDGKVEVNAYQSSNGDWNSDVAAGKVSDVDTRVQVNMGFDLNDDAAAVVSIVKNDRQYGKGSQRATDGAANSGVMNNLIIEQAYLNLKGVLGLDHKVGRQYYGEEGDLVIYYGPTSMPYQVAMPVSAIDGYTGWYKADNLDMHAIVGKDTDENTSANPDDDSDLFGLVAKYDLMDDLKLGGYFYRYNTKAEGVWAGPADRIDTIGAKADGKFMGFTYHGEVAKNMGKANENVHQGAYAIPNATFLPNNTTGKYQGMAFLANAKYDLDVLGKWTFSGEYAMGTGDDKNTDDKLENFWAPDSDYRPGLIWGGFDGNSGLSGNGMGGLTTWNVGAKWNPEMIEKLTLSGGLYYLAPTEDKINGASIGYDTFGTEFDLCANWQHSENVGLKAYYAMFMPDSDYAVATNGAGAKDDAEQLIGAALTVKF